MNKNADKQAGNSKPTGTTGKQAPSDKQQKNFDQNQDLGRKQSSADNSTRRVEGDAARTGKNQNSY